MAAFGSARGRSRVVVVTSLVAVALIAAALLAGTYALPVPAPSTPQGIVARYYLLDRLGRTREADALLAPEFLATHHRDSAADSPPSIPGRLARVVIAVAMRSSLRVGAPSLEGSAGLQGEGAAAGYTDVQDLDVRYVDPFGDDTALPGEQYWFVQVGRRSTSQPWRILSFGTGG